VTPEEIQSKYHALVSEHTVFMERYQREISELQKACTHEKYQVGWYSYRIGANSLMQICECCGHIIGPPTREEVLDFTQQEKAAMKKTWAENYPGIPFPKEFEQGESWQ
jgi:hypothetical protein